MASYEENLAVVRARAEEVWPASVVDDWFTSPNLFLSGARPIDVLKLDGPDVLLGVLDAEEGGVYA